MLSFVACHRNRRSGLTRVDHRDRSRSNVNSVLRSAASSALQQVSNGANQQRIDVLDHQDENNNDASGASSDEHRNYNDQQRKQVLNIQCTNSDYIECDAYSEQLSASTSEPVHQEPVICLLCNSKINFFIVSYTCGHEFHGDCTWRYKKLCPAKLDDDACPLCKLGSRCADDVAQMMKYKRKCSTSSSNYSPSSSIRSGSLSTTSSVFSFD